ITGALLEASSSVSSAGLYSAPSLMTKLGRAQALLTARKQATNLADSPPAVVLIASHWTDSGKAGPPGSEVGFRVSQPWRCAATPRSNRADCDGCRRTSTALVCATCPRSFDPSFPAAFPANAHLGDEGLPSCAAYGSAVLTCHPTIAAQRIKRTRSQ